MSIGSTDSAGSVLQAAGNCGSTASSLVLCSTYPNVAGALGVTTPSIERYVIKDGTGATNSDQASVLAIFKNPTDGRPFGGYYRAFAEAGHVGSFDGPGNLKKTAVGTNSGVKWSGYVGTSTNEIEGDGDYTIDNFLIETADTNGCAKSTGTWSSALDSASNSEKKVFACRLD